MVAANVLFYTRRASTAYNTYGIGKKVVKTLPKESPFRIREIIRYQGVVWVKSGLGHWYQFTNDLFGDASCHSDHMVYLSPAGPYGGKAYSVKQNGKTVYIPEPGRIYAGKNYVGGGQVQHVQPKV